MDNSPLSKPVAALLSALAFTALFYEQHLGLNMAIYGLVLSALAFLILSGNTQRLKVVIPFAIATVAAGIHGTNLSQGIAIAAFIVFAAQIASPRVEPISAIALGFINILISPIRLITKSTSSFHLDSLVIKRIVSFVLIPAAFVALFSILYAGSNPIFERLLAQIDWDFINIKLFWVFVLGALISVFCFFFYVPPLYTKLFGIKENSDDEVIQRAPDGLMKQTWVIVLITLSVLIAFVIASDVYYRLVLNEMPNGLTFSSYLHRGVFSLILSILFAIVLIALIFSREARSGEKITATIFMALNALYVILNAGKNMSYIEQYGLTLKRIGVYLYLLMTLLGILYTLLVVYNKLSFKQLVRVNSHSIFYTLILFGCFNWERTITKHNLSHIPAYSQEIDYNYLFNLGSSNTDLLLNHDLPLFQKQSLTYRINTINNKMDRRDYRSLTLTDYIVHQRITSSKYEQE